MRPTTTTCIPPGWMDVCLGAWGFGGMYLLMALSRLCREESLKGRRVAHLPPATYPLPPCSPCLRKLVPLGSALSPLRWRGKLRRSWVEGVYKHKPRPLWPPSPPPPHSARCTLTGAAARGLPLSHARQPAIWRSPHSPPGSAASGLAEPSLTLGWAASDLAGPSLTPLNQGTTDFLLFAC